MGNIVEIDGKMGKKKIVEEMAHLLKFKETKAPRKPPRIILMGPPGADMDKHALALA